MLTTASQLVVVALGAFVCAFSIWGLYAPARLCKFAIDFIEKSWAIAVAVLGRLVLGAALIAASPTSRFPEFFHFLGWLAIVAAVIILFMGRDRLRKLGAWFGRLSNLVIRVWLTFALLFGGVLVYGIMQVTTG
jgi:hypothetical protein